MSLRVYNTLSQEKELFEPVRPGKVGIYLCGPTVYKPSHIGHAVGPIIFDTIKRYLVYKGFDVTWVVNITDVDDKLIVESKAQGTTVYELADRITAGYLEAIRQLGVTSIDHLPKASEHIPEIIDMCRRLIDKGAAYVSGGDVYFDVSADTDYGKLSHRKPEEQQAGTRELASGEKRNPGDFALWKASKPDEPPEVQFDSPWGKGRPGWHIECSAMSVKYLGETFDIHGGGMDLMFPHHENEIAQSETCFDKPFAKYWLHNGLTRFNTKKISKSDQEMARKMGELTLTHLLSKHSPELLRYFIISTHYRRPIEFSDEEIAAKKKGLDTFYRLFERIERACRQDPYQDGPTLEQAFSSTENHADQSFIRECLDHQLRFLEAMDDDFNTGGAVGSLFEMATTINRFIDEWRLETEENPRGRDLAMAAVQTLRSLARILGLFDQRPPRAATTDHLVDDLMDVLIALRAEARKAKQYTLADLVRDRLKAVGISLEDRPGGTVWRRES
ncbi:MAG TPA: cysteine--tRNA ligase [Phycisphaerae bacterium]|nr:cysteine--tRNA ligase [Phycisphaerae bacterium]HOB73762.1 cysteine--tRNA ligase [Phycisphaerae bacterium]HOJ53364.1 cysteine--tRNA ligase [Phycisphaerae bacterium]HOL25512.1 cysteine--tRNA ligase [Phycisphaerae bacterium]HPP19811.1 cysteine--tRNA ligase [Phycisphaerae bacterium]